MSSINDINNIQDEMTILETKIDQTNKKINKLIIFRNLFLFVSAVGIGISTGFGLAGILSPAVIATGVAGVLTLIPSIALEVSCKKQEKIAESQEKTLKQLTTLFAEKLKVAFVTKTQPKPKTKRYKFKKVLTGTKDLSNETPDAYTNRFNKTDESFGKNGSKEK